MDGIYPASARFVRDHQGRGPLTYTTTIPDPTGYRLSLRCPCEAVLARRVTPRDTQEDLVRSNLLASPN